MFEQAMVVCATVTGAEPYVILHVVEAQQQQALASFLQLLIRCSIFEVNAVSYAYN